MKFLASIFLAMAMRFDRKRFEADAAHQARLEKQVAELLLKYFNEETGPSFDNAPDWSPDNAGVLATFLKTETGQTLAKRFQVVAGNVAVAGCADSMHSAHSAGVGYGWTEACQWFLRLSRVVGDQATKHDEHAAEDETQLLERYSS